MSHGQGTKGETKASASSASAARRELPRRGGHETPFAAGPQLDGVLSTLAGLHHRGADGLMFKPCSLERDGRLLEAEWPGLALRRLRPCPTLLRSLIVDGIIAGVGAVITFLQQIVILSSYPVPKQWLHGPAPFDGPGMHAVGYRTGVHSCYRASPERFRGSWRRGRSRPDRTGEDHPVATLIPARPGSGLPMIIAAFIRANVGPGEVSGVCVILYIAGLPEH